MTRHQSGIRPTPIATARNPVQKFLSRSVEACLSSGIATRDELAQLFPDCEVQTMCAHDDFFIAMLNAATPLTVTPEAFEQNRDHYLLLVDIAIGETGRLSYRDMVRKVPVQTLAIHAEADRLWGFVARTRFWECPSNDTHLIRAESIMVAIIHAALDSELLTHEELVRFLRGAITPLHQELIWKPGRRNIRNYCLLLVDHIPIDALYLHVLVPLANRQGWDPVRFLQDEIPTNPDLKIGGLQT